MSLIVLKFGGTSVGSCKKIIQISKLIKKHYDQKNRVVNLLKKEGFYINSIQKDLAQNDRCIICTKI